MNDYSITTFTSVTNVKGQMLMLSWEDFVQRFKTPIRTLETMRQFEDLTNEERLPIKDVGGFVGGTFRNNYRSEATAEARCLLTLDADEASPSDIEDYRCMYDYKCLVHTTHHSRPEKPRYRWIFPLSRMVNSEDYTVLAMIVGQWVGADTLDETTYQAGRLMFWASIPCDAPYVFENIDGRVLNPDRFLQTPEAAEIREQLAAKKKKAHDEHLVDGKLMIPEGSRNKAVFGFASSLRSNGLAAKEIREMVDTYNEAYVYPSLPDYELDTIVNSVCKHYEPGELIAGSLRDAWDDFADLGTPAEKPKKKKGFEVMSSKELNNKELPPPTYFVEGLIPEGLTILGSPPKYGKSFMCIDLGLSIATGTDVLGLHTTQAGVVYMALEDGWYRLQDRTRKVLNGRDIPSNLLLTINAPKLEDGLLDAIDEFRMTNPVHPRVFIIDTLQKVRGEARKTEGVYGYDYRELSQIQEFALSRHLAIVVVHHTNKTMEGSDFMNRLSGSAGIPGAADSFIVLGRRNRKDQDTYMDIAGRDVLQRTYVLGMDWNQFRWINYGEEKSVEEQQKQAAFETDPVVQLIVEELDNAEQALDESGSDDYWVNWDVTPTDMLKELQTIRGDEYKSAVAVGRHIKEILKPLEDHYGILFEDKRSAAGKKYGFHRKR